MHRQSKPTRRVFLAAAVLLVALTSNQLLAMRAHAALTYCSSDPVVTLSNGAILDLSATISDSLSDVKNVAYVVHAPAGTHLVAVVNTDGLMGLKETVKFYADDAANTYDTSTTVSTGQKSMAVTASTKVVSVLNLTLGLKSVTGTSAQALLIHITSLL